MNNSSERQTKNFQIFFKNVGRRKIAIFASKTESAYQDFSNFLGIQLAAKVIIDISDEYKIPSTNLEENTIRIPANRLRGDVAGPPGARGRGPAIIHELTHIIARSVNKQTRYLDEGLAVYAEELFGFGIAYPNLGRDLHQEAAKYRFSEGTSVPVERLETLRVSSGPERTRRGAYLQEGSFVRYLIESRGIAKFLRMYFGDAYEQVYNESLISLEEDWVRMLKGRKQPEFVYGPTN